VNIFIGRPVSLEILNKVGKYNIIFSNFNEYFHRFIKCLTVHNYGKLFTPVLQLIDLHNI